MNSSTQITQQPEHELGDFLRYWRRQRGKSQLDLSLDTGVSQRHISFVESGRSVPSRELLLSLAKTLDVPLREQNVLLLASGYAPVYLESTWDAPEMAVVTRVIDLMLKQHEPHPAIVMDRVMQRHGGIRRIMAHPAHVERNIVRQHLFQLLAILK